MSALSFLLKPALLNQDLSAFNIYYQLARMNPSIPFPAEHMNQLKNSLSQMSASNFEEEKLLGDLSQYLQLLNIKIASGRISETAIRDELNFIDQLFKKINPQIIPLSDLLMLYQTYLITPVAFSQECINEFLSLSILDIPQNAQEAQERYVKINSLINLLLIMADKNIEENRYHEMTSQIIRNLDELMLPDEKSEILGRFYCVLKERNPKLSGVIADLLPVREHITQEFEIDRNLFQSDAWKNCSTEKLGFHLEILYKKEMTLNEKLNYAAALGKVASNTKDNSKIGLTTDPQNLLLNFLNDPNREKIFIRFLQSEYEHLPKLVRIEREYLDDYSPAYKEIQVEYLDASLLDKHIAFMLSLGLSLDKIKRALPNKESMHKFNDYYPLFEDELQINSKGSDETWLPIFLHTWSILASEEDQNVFLQGYSNLSKTAGENPLNGISQKSINALFMILGAEMPDFLNNVMLSLGIKSVKELFEQISWDQNSYFYFNLYGSLSDFIQRLKAVGKIKENPPGFFQLICDLSNTQEIGNLASELNSKIDQFISMNLKMENYVTLIELSQFTDLAKPEAEPLVDAYRKFRTSFNAIAKTRHDTFSNFVHRNGRSLEFFSKALGPDGIILLNEFLKFFGLDEFYEHFNSLQRIQRPEEIAQLYKKLPSPHSKESLYHFFSIISDNDFNKYPALAELDFSLEDSFYTMEIAKFDMVDFTNIQDLKKSISEYKQLKERFEKIESNKQKQDGTLSFNNMIINYNYKIKALTKFFGSDVFTVLQNHLTDSTQELELFLINLLMDQTYPEDLYAPLIKILDQNRGSILKDSAVYIKICELTIIARISGDNQETLTKLLDPSVPLNEIEAQLIDLVIERYIQSLALPIDLHEKSVILLKQFIDFFGALQFFKLFASLQRADLTPKTITELYKKIPLPASKETLEQFFTIVSICDFKYYESTIDSDISLGELFFALEHWNPRFISPSASTNLPKLIKDYKALKEKFEKLDSKVQSREQHGRFFNMMMNAYKNKIEHLSKVFGNDVFTVLQKYLTTSTLALERFLENLIINTNYPEELNLFLSNIFLQHHKAILSDPKVFIKSWELMIIAQAFFNTDQESLKKILNPSASLLEIEAQLSRLVIGKLTEYLGFVLSESDIEKIMKRISPHLLIRLIVASSRMGDNFLLTIFNEFLLSDLTGKTFGENNDSEHFTQLRAHNQNVRNELAQAGLNVELALNYNKKSTFGIAETRGDLDVETTCVAFWAAIQRLKELEPALTKTIEKFQVTLLGDKETKNGTNIPDKLTPEQQSLMFNKLESFHKKQGSQLSEFIQKIERTISKTRENTPVLGSEVERANTIDEFLGHLKTESESIHQALTQPHVKTGKKSFKVEVWDKTRFDTFDLGTQVGCCLAPDGGQFPAMVQRRMDDGMFMHVVTDTTDPKNPKPISLAWLYFGRDKDNPQDVYVVANFFEITASYGLDPLLRDTVVAHLQEYIGQYAKEVGAKGFLMNHLTYGHIPDFQGYSQQEIQLEKVGGFLALDDVSSPYYLNSLHTTQFHVFHSNKPEQKQAATGTPFLNARPTLDRSPASKQPGPESAILSSNRFKSD